MPIQMPAHAMDESPHALDPRAAQRVPVTVVCGVTGAGKARFIEDWMRSRSGKRSAVITDAGGDVGRLRSIEGCALVFHVREAIEAFLTRQVEQADQDALRQDLRQRLADGQIDEVLVAPDSAVEPLDLVSALAARYPRYTLADGLALTRVVTVLDCVAVQDDYASTAQLLDRHGLDPSMARTLANVVAAQIESADIVVLHNTDLAGVQRVREVNDILGVLNPHATRIETCVGESPPTVWADDRHVVVGADHRPGWLRTLDQPRPRTEVYPVARLLYHRRRPFHPERLATFLDTDWPWVLRVRGQFWVASRPDWAGDIQQAGRSVSIQPFGYWWASEPVRGSMPEDPQLRSDLERGWHPVYGDRRQRIAILGIDLDSAAMEQRLNDCLLTDAELAAGWDGWRELPDPWPVWV